ncbi:MAG: branched-chain amino acid transport system ATP-binding protein [Micromonosporaceae bacterium]
MPISSAETRPAALLQVREVAAGYGPVPVIREVSITVAAGEVVAVVGPNGAGKSTLLKCVLGILRPSRGSVELAGRQIGGWATERIARLGLGYVPQNNDVFEPLTVAENLDIGGYTLARREVPARMAEVFALYPALAAIRRRHAGNLSGGERKMLAMARVMMTRPRLLVLDEPTAGLAPALADEFLAVHITRLAGQGIGVLLVEQRTKAALAAADWAYVMASGQVLLDEDAAHLRERPDLGEVLLGQVVGASLPSGQRPQ